MTRSFFIFRIGLLLASTAGSLSAADHYYVNDHLATTTAVTDAAGEIAAIEADAFGTPVAGATQASRFTGKPYDDDIGAFVFPFRNYRSDEARWMSADPSGFPDGKNQNRYACNPLSSVDPTGLFSMQTSIVYQSAAALFATGEMGNFSSSPGTKTVAALYSIHGDSQNGFYTSAKQGFTYSVNATIILPQVGTSAGGGSVTKSFQSDTLTHENWHKKITFTAFASTIGAAEAWSAAYSSNLFQTSQGAIDAFNRDMISAYTDASSYVDNNQINEQFGHISSYAEVESGLWRQNDPDWGAGALSIVSAYSVNFNKSPGNYTHKE